MRQRMMNRRPVLGASVVVVIASVVGCGCSVAYNGAIVSESSRKNAKPYSATDTSNVSREARDSDALMVGLGPAAPAPVEFAETPNPAPQIKARPQDRQRPQTGPQSRAQPRSRDGQRSLGPIGLFGAFPNDQGRTTSPMDPLNDLSRVTFAPEGVDFDPDIDTTGTRLVYASTQHRTTSDLYLKSVNGKTVTQLTSDPANDVMPAFSPDGRRVAFASDRSGNWDLYLVDINGGTPIQLTSEPSHDLHPSFSPDGKQIVFSSLGSQSGQWELVVIDVENPSLKRFIGYGLFPEWSPVDNRIVFQRARERGTHWFSVWTVDLIDGDARRPTEIAASSNAAAITPTWSPDGRKIAFSTVINPQDQENGYRPTQADVWVVNADGTGRTNLTQSQFANLQPDWAASGTIYFVSNRDENGRENIWSARPAGGMKVADAPGEGGERSAAVATDQ